MSKRTFDPNRAAPVKHLFAKAGTPQITGEGVYALDHYAHDFTPAMVREIQERYAEFPSKLERAMVPSYVDPKKKVR
jgi:hypothetical protein